MTLQDWFEALKTSITGKKTPTRRKLWNRKDAAEKLESRVLLSASPADPELLFVQREVNHQDDPGRFPAAYISINLVNIETASSVESAAAVNDFGPVGGELADDGGAVWGTVADEGIYDGGGDGNAADGLEDCAGPSDHDGGVDGIWGTIADGGTLEGQGDGEVTDILGADFVLPPDYSDLCGNDLGDGGVDDSGVVDDGVDGGNVDGGGVGDGDGGVGDGGVGDGGVGDGGVGDGGVGDGGVGDGGVGDGGVGDGGVGDGGVGDGGVGDGGVGDGGVGDGGVGDGGVGDGGIGDGDGGVGDGGAGDGGAGDGDIGGGEDPTVSVELDTTELPLWEGPYYNEPMVKAETPLNFRRTKLNSDIEMQSVTLTLTLGGDAIYGEDYYIYSPNDDVGQLPPFGDNPNQIKMTLDKTSFSLETGLDQFIIKTIIDGEFDDEESITISITGMSAIARPNGNQSASGTIDDRTADIDVDNLDDVVENTPGITFNVNDNDDNDNGVPDKDDKPNPLDDTDWQELTITGQTDPEHDFTESDIDGQNYETHSEYFLEFDTESIDIRLKSNPLIRVVPGLNGSKFRLDPDQTVDLIMQGMKADAGDISLNWVVTANQQLVTYYEYDTIQYSTWSLDVDIDSDNNNDFNFPENTDWEEEIEAHHHALGKLIKKDATHFTPVRLRLPANLEDGDVTVTLNFSPHGESGIIKTWNKSKADTSRDPTSRSAKENGNRIYPETYFLSELNYEPASGGITLWIEAIDVMSRHWDKHSIEANGKPDDRISVTLNIPGKHDIELEDEVKYMVIEKNSFYDNLQSRPELRSALASEGVYASGEGANSGGGADLPQFALRKLSPKEMQDLGISNEVIGYFNDTSPVAGFEATLYRDYVTKDYIIAFAGTDDVHDIIEDIWQGVGESAPQYDLAMKIGEEFLFNEQLTNRTTITGHSLGGGLASAAAVVGNFPAITFNAAGLVESTLLNDVGGEKHVGSLANYENASTLIDAYYLDWDLLSFVQDWTPLQEAIGTRHIMEGPVDEDLYGWTLVSAASFIFAALSEGATWPSVVHGMGEIVRYMGLAHTTGYYQYGLLVEESIFGIYWDIYGYDFY